MEAEPVLREYLEGQRRFYERLEEIRIRTGSILAGLEQRLPSVADTEQLDAMRGEREKLFQDHQLQAGALIEHLRKLEQSNRRSAVAEKRTRPQRSQAQIEKLSEELTTKLRLERVDDAMKELLDFLADAEFFAASATTGRRRRLRAVQNAIEKALAN